MASELVGRQFANSRPNWDVRRYYLGHLKPGSKSGRPLLGNRGEVWLGQSWPLRGDWIVLPARRLPSAEGLGTPLLDIFKREAETTTAASRNMGEGDSKGVMMRRLKYLDKSSTLHSQFRRSRFFCMAHRGRIADVAAGSSAGPDRLMNSASEKCIPHRSESFRHCEAYPGKRSRLCAIKHINPDDMPKQCETVDRMWPG